MLSIGLTGGVGCGKTAVADLLDRHGVPIVDADVITRELVAPGTSGLQLVHDAFGDEVLRPDGALDRRKLRQIVFADPRARTRLESILHPLVRAEMRARLGQLAGPYCVMVIPLLVESAMTDMVDRVLVVDCDEAQQVARVAARDDASADDVKAIMATQVSREARLAVACDVIRNTGDLDRLADEVAQLHRRYLALARQ